MKHRAGLRAHDIGSYSETELPQQLAAAGIPYVQLTLEDAFGAAAPAPAALNTGYATRIRRAFESSGVAIAVLSCYINPIHPDVSVRRAQLDRFITYLQYARDFGCSVIATETGSRLPDLSYAPMNHETPALGLLLDSLGEMVAAASRYGITVAIEGVHKFVAHDPSSIQSILQAIPDRNLQVILDPVNLLHRGGAPAMTLVEESFARYGSRIAALHAKDFVLLPDGGVRSVPVGRGQMEWAKVAALCARHKPWLPIILEESAPQQMQAELRRLDEAFALVGERIEQEEQV